MCKKRYAQWPKGSNNYVRWMVRGVLTANQIYHTPEPLKNAYGTARKFIYNLRTKYKAAASENGIVMDPKM